MYIHPFLAGVIATIMCELIACIIYAAYCGRKKEGGNKHGENRTD
jgi:hypothetical protein